MIRWGIIGAGTIAHRFAESLAHVEQASLYAVANRTQEKAEAFKKKHHAQIAYSDYQALLDDPKVDFVYIALPHRYHFEWILQAIHAKKAILCEKPLVLSADELKELHAVWSREPVFFMEAMKSRFTPAYEQARQHILAGEIGELKKIETSLRRHMPQEGTTYHYLPIQGGCLLDMGIYNVGIIEDFVKTPLSLEEIQATLHDNGIEIAVEARLSSDTLAVTIESGFDQFKEAKAVFKGTTGTITIPDFHRPTRFIIERDGVSETVDCPYTIDDFYGEITHAMTCYENGQYESPIMPLSDSLRCAEIIDQLKAGITAL